MAYLFGGEEWLQAYREQINQSEKYARVGATWEGDFYFVIVASEMYDQTAIYYVDLWHGKCRGACCVQDEAQFRPAFRLETSDANWKAVVEKRLDPIQGMMTRRIKLTGDLAKIMRYVPAAQELVNCATRVPTTFPPRKG